MANPFFLLKAVGKAALNFVGGGVAGDVVFDVVPDLAADAWKWWHRERDAEQRRQDLAAVAQATPADCQMQVQAIVQELAADRSPAQQEALGLYLSLVPGQVRKSLRRPSDPTGTTVPADLALNKPDDLVALLPTRLPRFKPGDRPLPGVDWELDELLGIGGFGEVWRAKHAFFDGVAPVALKFCLDPTAAGYLRNEAAVLHRVMSQGRHPGIIPLQHTYLSAETPCLEYELVTGGDLAGLIQEWHRGGNKPAPLTVCRAVYELAQIIGHAHAQSPPIVHRDLKPANVLRQVGPDGSTQLKVADFGIGGVATRQAIVQQTRGTSPGLFLATALRGSCTPLYASPQQMRGEPPDPRDDVYALGVIWYQMHTGDLTNGRPGGTRWQKRLEEAGLARPLVELLGECLEDGLDDRAPDANALARRLRELMPAVSDQALSASPVTPALTPVAGPQWRKEAPEPTGASPSALLADKQLRRQEELRQQLADADRAARAAPGDATRLARRGELHRLMGQHDLAAADCTEAIRIDARLAAAYATRAGAYRAKGQLDLAIADSSVAIELDPTDRLAWYTRGEAYRLKGDVDRAIADSSEAIRLDPDYSWAYGTRGAAWQRQGDLVRAVADLDELLRLDPTNAWAYAVRGDVYRNMGDHDRAITDCNEAIRLQPENSFAYSTRGAAFRQKGDFATAMADLNQALRLRPDNQFARDQLALARKRQR